MKTRETSFRPVTGKPDTTATAGRFARIGHHFPYQPDRDVVPMQATHRKILGWPSRMVLASIVLIPLTTAWSADPVNADRTPAELVNEAIAELDDLLQVPSDPTDTGEVIFGGKDKIEFQRPQTGKSAKDLSTSRPHYLEFESVDVEVRPPMEHVTEPGLTFEAEKLDPESIEAQRKAANEPLFEESVELGTPGLNYTPEARQAIIAKQEAEVEAAEAKRRRLAALDGEVVDEEEVDSLDENADEIKRRLVLDDSSAPLVQNGDRWYVPIESMTHVQLERRERIREVLDLYYARMLNTRDDSPWSMMHHMIAWGTDARIWVDAPGGRHESCIGWLCANGTCEGARLLYVHDGLLSARIGPGLQGHTGQFLAMLAQTRVRVDQPIRVNNTTYTVKDLIKQEQLTCRPATELTFKLIGLVHYLNTDAEWVSSTGEHWNIERLIREEMRQPINGTTCGGTHRLMGMTYALRRRQQEGKPIDGEFLKAKIFTERYQQMAYDMQNQNGTFNSDFWRSRGNWGDIDRKMKTTGHILEWMVFSKAHDELQDPRMIAAVDWLTQIMMDNRYYDFEKGPLGHGIRALSLYDERVYGGAPGKREYMIPERPVVLAKRAASSTSNSNPNSRRAPTATATPQPQRRRGGGIFGGFRRR